MTNTIQSAICTSTDTSTITPEDISHSTCTHDNNERSHDINGNTKNCQVAIRVRPLSRVEQLQNPLFSMDWDIEKNSLTLCHAQQRYIFDHVFDPHSTQEDIFKKTCLPLIEQFFSGFNCCIFAYGQTGSGKTYTMGSASHMIQSSTDSGILPRAAISIFERVRERRTLGQSVDINVTFLEVYNEDLRDLLDPEGASSHSTWNTRITNSSTTGKVIRITEDPVTHAICVVGAKSVAVESEIQLLDCLGRGGLCRRTASNKLNSNSSRSHAIFTVTLSSRGSFVAKGQTNGDLSEDYQDILNNEFISAKFHFVDLAGSERIKRTQAEGHRLKEGISINTGLLALSNVINALTADDRPDGAITHIPYRDSKLTRILQDSLGGNSKTLMIACLSGAADDFLETYNTIKYAIRARNIKNIPIVNRDPRAVLVEDYQRQIHNLTVQLLAYRRETRVNQLGSNEVGSKTIEKLQDKLQRRKEKEKRLRQSVKQLLSQLILIDGTTSEDFMKNFVITPRFSLFAPYTKLSSGSMLDEPLFNGGDRNPSLESVELTSKLSATFSESRQNDAKQSATQNHEDLNELVSTTEGPQVEVTTTEDTYINTNSVPEELINDAERDSKEALVEFLSKTSNHRDINAADTLPINTKSTVAGINEALELFAEFSASSNEEDEDSQCTKIDFAPCVLNERSCVEDFKEDEAAFLEAHYAELSIHIGHADSLLRGAKSEQAQYMSIVGNMREQISELTKRLEESTSQKEELKTEISSTRASQESTLKLKQADLKARYEDEIKKVKHFRKELIQLTRQLEKVAKRKADSEKHIEALQKNLETMRAERQKTRKKIQEQEARFRKLLARKETQITQMKRNAVQQASEVKRKERQYEKLQKQNDNLLKKIKHMETSTPTIISSRPSAGNRSSTSRTNSEREAQWDGDIFRAALRKATIREIEQKKLSRWKQEISEMDKEIEAYKLNLSTYETELKALRANHIGQPKDLLRLKSLRQFLIQISETKDTIDALEKQKMVSVQKLEQQELQLLSSMEEQQTASLDEKRSWLTSKFIMWLQRTSSHQLGVAEQSNNIGMEFSLPELEGLFDELLSLQLQALEAKEREECRQAELEDLKISFEALCYKNCSLENELTRQRYLLKSCENSDHHIDWFDNTDQYQLSFKRLGNTKQAGHNGINVIRTRLRRTKISQGNCTSSKNKSRCIQQKRSGYRRRNKKSFSWKKMQSSGTEENQEWVNDGIDKNSFFTQFNQPDYGEDRDDNLIEVNSGTSSDTNSIASEWFDKLNRLSHEDECLAVTHPPNHLVTFPIETQLVHIDSGLEYFSAIEHPRPHINDYEKILKTLPTNEGTKRCKHTRSSTSQISIPSQKERIEKTTPVEMRLNDLVQSETGSAELQPTGRRGTLRRSNTIAIDFKNLKDTAKIAEGKPNEDIQKKIVLKPSQERFSEAYLETNSKIRQVELQTDDHLYTAMPSAHLSTASSIHPGSERVSWSTDKYIGSSVASTRTSQTRQSLRETGQTLRRNFKDRRPGSQPPGRRPHEERFSSRGNSSAGIHKPTKQPVDVLTGYQQGRRPTTTANIQRQKKGRLGAEQTDNYLKRSATDLGFNSRTSDEPTERDDQTAKIPPLRVQSKHTPPISRNKIQTPREPNPVCSSKNSSENFLRPRSNTAFQDSYLSLCERSPTIGSNTSPSVRKTSTGFSEPRLKELTPNNQRHFKSARPSEPSNFVCDGRRLNSYEVSRNHTTNSSPHLTLQRYSQLQSTASTENIDNNVNQIRQPRRHSIAEPSFPVSLLQEIMDSHCIGTHDLGPDKNECISPPSLAGSPLMLRNVFSNKDSIFSNNCSLGCYGLEQSPQESFTQLNECLEESVSREKPLNDSTQTTENEIGLWKVEKITLTGTDSLRIKEGCLSRERFLTSSKNSVQAWDEERLLTSSTACSRQPLWAIQIDEASPNGTRYQSQHSHITTIEGDGCCVFSHGPRIYVIDPRVGEIVSSWEYCNTSTFSVTAITNADGGNSVAVCGTDSAIRLFDLRRNGTNTCRAGTLTQQNALSYIPLVTQPSPNHTESPPLTGVVTGGDDGLVRIWKEGWLPLDAKHSFSVNVLEAERLNSEEWLLISGAQQMKAWKINITNPALMNSPTVVRSYKPSSSFISAVKVFRPQPQSLVLLAGDTSGNVSLNKIEQETSTKTIQFNPLLIELNDLDLGLHNVVDGCLQIEAFLLISNSSMIRSNTDYEHRLFQLAWKEVFGKTNKRTRLRHCNEIQKQITPTRWKLIKVNIGKMSCSRWVPEDQESKTKLSEQPDLIHPIIQNYFTAAYHRMQNQILQSSFSMNDVESNDESTSISKQKIISERFRKKRKSKYTIIKDQEVRFPRKRSKKTSTT